MIAPEWCRIAGLHAVDDGTIAIVWLAHDKETDTLHLYDSAVFKREVMAVIAEGINARGRWVPLSFEKRAKDVAEKLLERGANTITEPVEDNDTLAELTSRDIWERMRSGRFKVDKRLADWLDEYRTFNREQGKVPADTHPLMTATRHAVARLDWARRQQPKRSTTQNHPKVAIV